MSTPVSAMISRNFFSLFFDEKNVGSSVWSSVLYVIDFSADWAEAG
jgi:hypothetical protein